MALPSTDPAIAEWITGRQACRVLGCASHALQRAALLGSVRTKIDPGIPIRYHRADVEKLAGQRAASPRPRRKAESAGREVDRGN